MESQTQNALDAPTRKPLTGVRMSPTENQRGANRAVAKKTSPLGIRKPIAVLAVVLTAWCAAIQGAEIHDAAELGDLGKVKECMAKDPAQINATDAKGRTPLTCAVLSGKKEIVD